MEALLQEHRTTIAPVHMMLASALLGHRRDAAEARQTRRVLVALALRTDAGQQARAQHRPGAGQALEDRPVGMRPEDCGQSLVKLSERALQILELAADELHAQRVALQHRGFVGQGHGV